MSQRFSQFTQPVSIAEHTIAEKAAFATFVGQGQRLNGKAESSSYGYFSIYSALVQMQAERLTVHRKRPQFWIFHLDGFILDIR